MRGIMQQPSTAIRYHTDRFPKRMLLLPRKLFAWTCCDIITLLWSGWHTTYHTGNGINGHKIKRTSWLSMHEVWRFFTIKSSIYCCFFVCNNCYEMFTNFQGFQHTLNKLLNFQKKNSKSVLNLNQSNIVIS